VTSSPYLKTATDPVSGTFPIQLQLRTMDKVHRSSDSYHYSPIRTLLFHLILSLVHKAPAFWNISCLCTHVIWLSTSLRIAFGIISNSSPNFQDSSSQIFWSLNRSPPSRMSQNYPSQSPRFKHSGDIRWTLYMMKMFVLWSPSSWINLFPLTNERQNCIHKREHCSFLFSAFYLSCS
jgi:hypothetical protein